MIAYDPIVQELNSALFDAQNLSVDVLRLDLIHPQVSGNKWFKLKRNLEEARKSNLKTIVTFGGAFSNHIAATATACRLAELRSVGFIRGEKVAKLNTTLKAAQQEGMQLHFVDRETYSQKDSEEFKVNLKETYGECYLIPEGGNNVLGIKGCTEILQPQWVYDYILCASGTGTTFAGLLASLSPGLIVGINVLKGENRLPDDVCQTMKAYFPEIDVRILGNEELTENTITNHFITNSYCFKGYAKFDLALLEFKKRFEEAHHMPLDHIYTAKLFYALFDLVEKKKFRSNSRLLVIHSGGLQGNAGFESRFLSNSNSGSTL